jgi:hypothetical protein
MILHVYARERKTPVQGPFARVLLQGEPASMNDDLIARLQRKTAVGCLTSEPREPESSCEQSIKCDITSGTHPWYYQSRVALRLGVQPRPPTPQPSTPPTHRGRANTNTTNSKHHNCSTAATTTNAQHLTQHFLHVTFFTSTLSSTVGTPERSCPSILYKMHCKSKRVNNTAPANNTPRKRS